MYRSLLIAVLAAIAPAATLAAPRQEMQESDFLDLVDGASNALVDGAGNALVQGRGVDEVNAKARSQGLQLPALGYWSPEGHCFVKPAPGDCNGVFRK